MLESSRNFAYANSFHQKNYVKDSHENEIIQYLENYECHEVD